ncbi:uncharacterized protein LOC108115418 [Drosophila eugracilis]|uniref:uncharacterized protein LOC108115418 n=1 Tax=Drosophila eugracilis TaxID=29029 RepID=UPI0007E70E79|nr:uncharacterized protein LOC108115418 [Drosophila eugracilis]
MKIIAILILANIDYIVGLTIGELNRTATKQLEEIVEKYKPIPAVNVELSTWIKKVENVSRTSPIIEKFNVHAQFKHYNENRILWENNIKNRIKEIDEIIKKLVKENTEQSKICLKYYKRQKKSLETAHKFSNKTKISNLGHNSKICNPEREKKDSNESDEYSYY